MNSLAEYSAFTKVKMVDQVKSYTLDLKHKSPSEVRMLASDTEMLR